MFIGINNTTRRRVLREALTAHIDTLRAQEALGVNIEQDLEHVESVLREINAAESLGKPVAPGASTVPSHYGDR